MGSLNVLRVFTEIKNKTAHVNIFQASIVIASHTGNNENSSTVLNSKLGVH